MGYHVKIIRTEGQNEIPITLKETAAVVSKLKDLEIDLSKNQITSISDQEFVLFYTDGEWWAKNPSDGHLEIMIFLSSKLGARVRGDEMETYKSLTVTYQHPDDIEAIEVGNRLSNELVLKSSRHRWKSIIFVFIVFFVGPLILKYFGVLN